MKLTKAMKEAARRHGVRTGTSHGFEHIYQVQPLIVEVGPYAGRVCENDDDDFLDPDDPRFADLVLEYEISKALRYGVDEDGVEYFGIPCQYVYFGSAFPTITLKSGGALIPNYALRPANTNDFVQRMSEIHQEIFANVGANLTESELEWEEAFLLSNEQNFILGELWAGEVKLRANSGEAKNVFLCHASPDKPFVRRVAADLKKAGHRVWLDEFEIKAGESIVEKISLGTARADALILFVSANSNQSDWVRREWQSVMSRMLSKEQVRIIPARIEDCKLPPIMSDIKYADFVESYVNGLDEIRASLEV